MRILVGLILVMVALSLAGCNQWRYIPTPSCEYGTPPNPDQWGKAGPSEQLVLMTMAYTGQVRKTTECNAIIDKVNASNTALFQ